MKILLAPDKFKGSLTAIEVCEIIREAIVELHPDYEVLSSPMADGGEGSMAVIKRELETEEVKMFVKDPLFRAITASYERKGDVAFIEMAAASGLQLIKKSQQNPLYTTTYGTGQLIKHAIKNGVAKVYLFVGGSATTDGGMGMLQSLGFQFLDKNGEDLFGIGESMEAVCEIIRPENLPEFELDIVCDVENTFHGENGAAFIYGAQKGANEAEIDLLEKGLQNLSLRFREDLGVDISQVKGSGAAGGIAGGAMAGLNGQIAPGIETIMDIIDFDKKLNNVDLVITGEGKIDQQTLHGKLIAGLAKKAGVHNIPIIAFCGVNELSELEINELGLQKVISIKNSDIEIDVAINNGKRLLYDRVKTMFA